MALGTTRITFLLQLVYDVLLLVLCIMTHACVSSVAGIDEALDQFADFGRNSAEKILIVIENCESSGESEEVCDQSNALENAGLALFV